MSPSISTPLTVHVFHEDSDEYVAMLTREHAQIRTVILPDLDAFERELPTVRILLTAGCPAHLLAQAKELRWLQCTNAGVEFLLPVAEQLHGVTVTNARGIHSNLMADYVMAVLGAWQWDFPALRTAQARKVWEIREIEPLADKVLGVIGMGTIGTVIAQRAAAAGMRVLGVKRVLQQPIPGVERIEGLSDLNRVLAECDYVVATVPNTSQTQRLFNTERFAEMKPGAYFINIARGSVVDEKALLAAVLNGHLAGAALDVFDVEPLPTDSGLWDAPGLLVTPHISGNPANYRQRVGRLFLDNLQRFVTDAPLLNRVDLQRGY